MKRKIPGGPLYEVPDADSIPGMLSRARELYPDRTAITEPSGDEGIYSRDYAGLHSDVESLARGLLRKRGEIPVAGIVGRNSIAWCRAYLAVLRAGGVVVPIDRELPFGEMYSILERSGADTVFFDLTVSDGFAGKSADSSPGLRRIRMDAGIDDDCAFIDEVAASGEGENLILPDSFDTAAPAVICYTSGTTGRSKGVVLTQENLLSDIRQMYQFIEIRQDDIFMSVLPFHHTYECTCGLLGPLSLGASIFICRGLRNVVDDLQSSRATVMLGVPLLWEAVYRRIMDGIGELPGGRLKFALAMTIAGATDALGLHWVRKKLFSRIHERFGGSLRLMISGGAAIDPEVVRGFERFGFGFLQGYGLTETSPIVSVNRIGGNRYGSVGPPLPDMEVCIREPDASGIGEISVRGPNVMTGYHDDPAATAEVLSTDGWFRTGDFGYLDDDGYLFVTGRKKNVIVAKNGKNVFPEEIETVLNRSPVVSESMVFGRESHLKGEEIWVVVVPDEEILGQDGDAVEAVRRGIRRYNASTAPYRHITAFILREEELPRTTTKKIRRRDVFPDGDPGEEDAHRA